MKRQSGIIGSHPVANNKNNRGFSRAFVRKRVEITGEGGVILAGELNDVSVNGLFVGGREALPVDTEYPIAIVLETAEDDAIQLLLKGRVTRATNEGIAFQFTEIDADSLDHLRNLVMYNAEDPDTVELELDEHVAFRRPG